MPPHRFTKGDPKINRNGRPLAYRDYLRTLIGERGEKAYDLFFAVMNGELSVEVLAREPGPDEDVHSVALIPTVRKVPSIRERMDAAQVLAEALNGKAVSTLEVNAGLPQTGPQRDYSRLTEAQLEALEASLRLAAGEVVEGEVLSSTTAALPEGGAP